MSAATLSPQARKMREAVKEYCGKTGVNAATLGTVTEKFVGLLTARWEHICDVALAEENEGRVNVGLRISFDMTHKTPVGSLTLSFSQRTRDESTFAVEDPDQATLPFAEVVRQSQSMPSESSQSTPSSDGATSTSPSAASPTTGRPRRSRRSAATPVPSPGNAVVAEAAPAPVSGTDERTVTARPLRRRRPPQQPQPVTQADDTPF